MLSRWLGTEPWLHWKCSLVSCISGVPCSSTGLWGHGSCSGCPCSGGTSLCVPGGGAGSSQPCSAQPSQPQRTPCWRGGSWGWVSSLPTTFLPQPARPQVQGRACKVCHDPSRPRQRLPFIISARAACRDASPGCCSHSSSKAWGRLAVLPPLPLPQLSPPCSEEELGAAHAGNQGVCTAPTSPTSPGGCRGSDCSLLASAFSTRSCPGCRAGDRASLQHQAPASHPALSQRVLMRAGCPRLLPACSRTRRSQAPPQNHPQDCLQGREEGSGCPEPPCSSWGRKTGRTEVQGAPAAR